MNLLRLIRMLWALCYLGRNESRDYNRMHGKWRVKYDDGLTSENMCFDVARDYASIGGGRVVFSG